MLQPEEFENQLRRCADGQLSIEDFEEWFALSSWNVHQQRDKHLTDTVFRVEHLFSSLSDGRLKLPDALREFAEAATLLANVQSLRRERNAISRRAGGFQPAPPSPYSIAKSQQFIPAEESNWLPGVLAFGSLDAGITLSFGG